MPGVPKGRGCDACRKQKKKCDQATPACARCTRLGIRCVGAGQQRYKFIHKSSDSNSASPESEPTQTLVKVRISEWTTPDNLFRPVLPDPLSLVPYSASDNIARHMIVRLEVKDLRYDTRCFGYFLRFIPSRIGSNRALDAATDAFTTSFANMHIGTNQVTTYPKHGKALGALRDALSGPQVSNADIGDTMCAIYMTMITDGLLSGHGGLHAQGIAVLLQATLDRDWKHPFEIEMLNVMIFSTLMECISNDSLQVEPWLSQLLDKMEPLCPSIVGAKRQEYEPESPHPSSLTLRYTARLVEQIRDPVPHRRGLERHYSFLMADRQKFVQHVVQLVQASIDHKYLIIDRHGLRIMTLFAGIISMAMSINGLLQQFYTEAEDVTELKRTAEMLVQDALMVGERGAKLRPLGATHAQPALSVAWALTESNDTRIDCELLLHSLSQEEGGRDEYHHLFTTHTREARWWKWKFKKTKSQIDYVFGRKDHIEEEFLQWQDSDCNVQ